MLTFYLFIYLFINYRQWRPKYKNDLNKNKGLTPLFPLSLQELSSNLPLSSCKPPVFVVRFKPDNVKFELDNDSSNLAVEKLR